MGKYITREHKKALEEEAEDLKTRLRTEIADKLSDSSIRDVTEDSEYAEAVTERDTLQERIENIEHILENSTIIDESVCNKEYVTLGAWVTVKIDNNERELRVVGATEADPAKGTISYESPLGEAVLGAKVGETVIVCRPDGQDQEIEIMNIRCE